MGKFKIFTYILTAITLIVFFSFLIWFFVLNKNISYEFFLTTDWINSVMILLVILFSITALSWKVLISRYGWSLNRDSGIIKYLLPSFDELSIFIMSYSFFFLLIINDVFKNDLSRSFFSNSNPNGIIIFVVFFIGAVLSVYHLFSPRIKTGFEKWIMLFFVAIVNLFIGINLGLYALKHTESFSIFFVIWNVANGFLLLVLMRTNIVDESALSEWNGPRYLAIVGIVIATIIVIICQYYYRLYWAFSLSITIAYCTTVNSFIIRILQHFSEIKNYDIGSKF